MASFVLVHGAWHGGWCWERVVPLLEAEGHRVDAVDLPGRGTNPAPPSGMTLDANARHVADRVRAAGEPVVLAGHSMGGISITQAAELVPEAVAALVYVTAFLPANGQSLVDLAANDPEALVERNVVPDESTGLATIREGAHRDTFYGECAPEDAAAATARLVPEALAVFVTPVSITEERAGSIRRVYVECVHDRAITIGKQREMVAARPCERVLSLDADHSPFLSCPEQLAAHLLSG